MTQSKNRDNAKRVAAKAALEYIQNGMLVGLGTGSTTTIFISDLIEKCKTTNLDITVFATSTRTYDQAKAGGLKLGDINKMITLDITVDGADEVDSQKRMIKGGGGALLREKIIASISREMVVIVDDDKVVDHFGKFLLPVEILPFAHLAILHQITQLGLKPVLRLNASGEIYITDNGNYIADISLDKSDLLPEEIEVILKSIPGVLETGFFFNMAGKVIIGYADGGVKIIP